MGLDQVAIEENLDHRRGGADVDFPADEFPGHRVERAASFDVDIRADRRGRPAGQHERGRWQRQRRLRLQGTEDCHRCGSAQRAAWSLACDVLSPGDGLGLHVLDRGELPSAPERVTDVGHRPFDRGLSLGFSARAGSTNAP